MFGPLVGVSVAALRTMTHLAFFQGSTGVLGPPWALLPTLCMLLGAYIAQKLLARKDEGEKTLLGVNSVIYLTAFAILVRTAVMPFIDYYVYRFLLPLVIGRAISEAFVLALMPWIVVFNITVPLYTIPIAYIVARRVGRALKVGSEFKLV